MNLLTRFSLKNPVAIVILAILLIVAGTISFQNLKVDLLPDIEFPQIAVQATYPGASPQDVEAQVTDPLEKQFEKLEDVKKIDSSSFESIAVVNLEFPFDSDMDDIKQEVESLIREAQLPDEVDTEVNRFSFGTIPIYNISLFAKGDTDVQRVYEEEMEPELNKITGVNSVSIGGQEMEKIEIAIDRAKAAEYGLTLTQVKQAIEAKSLSFPAGTVTENRVEIPVRVEEKLEKVEQLQGIRLEGNLPPSDSGGSPDARPASSVVTLEEIATIQTVQEQEEFTRFNGKPSLSLAVTKKQDANTVEVAEQVINVLERYRDQVDYAIGFDQAEGIKQSIDTLIKEGLFGALFASLAVLLFLRNLRATIIAIFSIPLSLLVSAIFLDNLGITLNVMTLGGMAVAVGRVVDDSIVVIENIFRRIRQRSNGEDRTQLVADSTREVMKAIVSSTLTTAVVFLPLAFVEGITGEFFRPFAFTVVSALLASLLVAVTIVPILGRISFNKVKAERKDGLLQRVYLRLIRSLLNRKALVIVVSIALLAASAALVPGLGFTFLPNEQQKTILGTIELSSSTPMEQTNEVALEIEQLLADRESIDSVTASVGGRDVQTGLKKKNQISYFIGLADGVNIDDEIAILEEEIRRITEKSSDQALVSLSELESGGPPTNRNVDVDLYSNDLNALQEAAAEVEAYMKDRDDLKDVTNNLEQTQVQWVVQIDPEKASAEGVAATTVLGLVSDRSQPVTIKDVKVNDEEKDIVLEYDEVLDTREDLEDLEVIGSSGPVKLSEIADVKETDQVTSIQKLNGKVYARVSGQVEGKNVQQASAQVIADVRNDVSLPEGVSLDAGSGSEETVQTFRELILAMVVAIGLVYLTMLVTFGKARIPFIILSSLIFVPIGAILGLYIAGEPLSVSAMIGGLMLIGIVTTNAIVLVDRVGQNRDKGMAIRDALLEAGKTRLRPILMTAFATIAALLPLAFTTSQGTLISKGLAVVVIGGLTSSTLLTLVIIPVIYELFFYREVKREQQSEKAPTT